MRRLGEPTQTVIVAQGGQVMIRHSQPVGTQWLNPEQARIFGRELLRLADLAEGLERSKNN